MIEANTRVNGTNQGGAGQKSPDWRQVVDCDEAIPG